MRITSQSGARDQWRLALVKYRAPALVLVVALIHFFIAARSVGPMYVYDEIGYLANANVIAGHGADWALCGSSYAVGYSALLAPLWWLPVSPLVIYQIAVFISAVLGVLAIWPATVLAKRFGATPGVALGIGALVTVVPARSLMSNYVLAENPLTVLVLCSAVLALRVAESSRRSDVILLGAVAGLASVVHARALPLVGVTIAWIVVRAIVRRTQWGHAIVASLLAGLLAVGGVVAQSLVAANVFADDSRVGDLVGHTSIKALIEVALGQAFIQVISWSLLTILGLFACASKGRADVRRRGIAGVASAWWWLGLTVVAQGGFFVWVLAGSAERATRFDIPIFGRYMDPFVVPLAILGAATLWVAARRRLVTIALIAAGVALVAYSALVLPRISLDARWIPFAIPSLNTFLDVNVGDDRPALLLAALVGAVGVAALWLSRGRARAGIAAALVVAAVISLGTDWWRVDPLEGDSRAPTVTGAFVLANPTHNATMAADLLPCLEANKIQYELAGNVTIVPHGGDYGSDLVVGPKDWPALAAQGFSRVMLTTFLEAAGWQYQG